MLGVTGSTPTLLLLLLGQKPSSLEEYVGGTVGGGGGEGTNTLTQLEMGPEKSEVNLGYALMAKYKGLSSRSLFWLMSKVKVVSDPGAKGNGWPLSQIIAEVSNLSMMSKTDVA